MPSSSINLVDFTHFDNVFLFFLSAIEIMEEFFPQIEGNLTKITWAHAVNSKKLLNQTLEGEYHSCLLQSHF